MTNILLLILYSNTVSRTLALYITRKATLHHSHEGSFRKKTSPVQLEHDQQTPITTAYMRVIPQRDVQKKQGHHRHRRSASAINQFHGMAF